MEHTSQWETGQRNSGTSNIDGWNLAEWPTQAHAFNTQELNDSGTDTDTVSSVGDTQYEYDDIPEGLDETQKAEELSWTYQRLRDDTDVS